MNKKPSLADALSGIGDLLETLTPEQKKAIEGALRRIVEKLSKGQYVQGESIPCPQCQKAMEVVQVDCKRNTVPIYTMGSSVAHVQGGPDEWTVTGICKPCDVRAIFNFDGDEPVIEDLTMRVN